MKIMIVGAGEVGFHTADRLSKEGHAVTLLERDPEVELRIRHRLNAMVVHGSGASTEALEKAGIDNVDMFIAVTDLDEVNLIACLLANDHKVDRIIARIKTLEYSKLEWKHNAARLGIDLIINPQIQVAEEICSAVSYTMSSEVAEFAHGRVLFIGYPIEEGSPLAGVSLSTLGAIKGLYRMVVTAISRDDQTIIPRGDDQICQGDVVYFVCKREDLASISSLFGLEEHRHRNIFILGGRTIGEEVASRLSKLNYRVKLIDRDSEHCEYLAQELEHVLILNTSGEDVETLRNEGIESGDTYIAVTEDDQTNILCSLLAKRHGCKRAIALVNQPEYVSLAPSLGVDVCISPRMATSSAILKYVRRGDVISVAMLEQSSSEVIEMMMNENNPHLGTPLKQLSVPKGSIIGAIVRQDTAIVPGGEDHLEAGDHVIIFSLPDAIRSVEEFFS